jgi:hypothetical protein
MASVRFKRALQAIVSNVRFKQAFQTSGLAWQAGD